MLQGRFVCATALFLFAISSTVSVAQPPKPEGMTFRALVLDGQAAPGSNGGVFKSLGYPSLNSEGTLAFKSQLQGTVVTFGALTGKLSPSGIYVAKNGTISRVVGTGDAVPNKASTFTVFGDPKINDAEEIAFTAATGPGNTTDGIFIRKGTSLVTISSAGDTAPGTGESTFTTLGRRGIAFNNAGTLAFQATFRGRQEGDGIFVYSNGDRRAVVLRGQRAPIGEEESFERIGDFAMNEAGQIVFVGTLRGPNVKQALFIADAKGIRPVASHGQQWAGDVLDRFSQPSISSSGDIAFVHGRVVPRRGSAVDFVSDGVLASSGGSASRIATTRYRARPADPIVTGDITHPLMVRTAQGETRILFAAWNDIKGRNALFLYSGDKLTQLLQKGDPSPAGGKYGLLGYPTINSSGRIAFVSRLEGTSARVGIFVN